MTSISHPFSDNCQFINQVQSLINSCYLPLKKDFVENLQEGVDKLLYSTIAMTDENIAKQLRSVSTNIKRLKDKDPDMRSLIRIGIVCDFADCINLCLPSVAPEKFKELASPKVINQDKEQLKKLNIPLDHIRFWGRENLLKFAAVRGFSDRVKWLLSQGCNVNYCIEHRSIQSAPAIFQVAEQVAIEHTQKVKMVNILLAAKADAMSRSIQGTWWIAMQAMNFSIFQLLVDSVQHISFARNESEENGFSNVLDNYLINNSDQCNDNSSDILKLENIIKCAKLLISHGIEIPSWFHRKEEREGSIFAETMNGWLFVKTQFLEVEEVRQKIFYEKYGHGVTMQVASWLKFSQPVARIVVDYVKIDPPQKLRVQISQACLKTLKLLNS